MEELWLTDPDANPDPDDYDIFEDHIMNTLWSSNMNIKIGSNLIHIFPNGRILIVDNADCQLFFSMVNDSTQNNPNARLGGPIHTNLGIDVTPDCWERGVQKNYRTASNPAHKRQFWYNNKAYANRFKIRVQEFNLGLFRWHTMNAKVKVYRGRSNGLGFRRFKTSIDDLGVHGKYHDNACAELGRAGNTADRARRSKHKAEVRTENLRQSIFIKDNDVVGSLRLPSLGNHYELLLITR